jgi:pyridoxamine 5'-phosphate oxidase-like protein
MIPPQAQAILETDPVAQTLLHSKALVRLAYVWTDGTPRVVPMWFHWAGDAVIMATAANAPKMKVLADNAAVAISIDTDVWPYRVLTIRGTIAVDTVSEPFPEYSDMARRYLGDEGSQQFLAAARQTFSSWVRLEVSPTQAHLIDFTTTFPSAWSATAAAPTG